MKLCFVNSHFTFVFKVKIILIYQGCDSTHYGINCTKRCSINCTIGCTKDTGVCYSCVDRKFGEYCDKTCGAGCVSGCDQYTGQCKCKPGWQGDRCEGMSLHLIIILKSMKVM